ncbi:MAG: ribosomal protein L7/L12 [Fimbriimonadaceae bacterium]
MENSRVTTVREQYAERALYFFISAAVLGIASTLMFIYGRGILIFAELLLLLALVALGFSVFFISKMKKVQSNSVTCPFCEKVNAFQSPPTDDFNCEGCHRMVPIREGAIMEVMQVRCGYCNELNFYSLKTEVLICETCDREIPIANEDGLPSKSIPRSFLRVDDDALYELVLTDAGRSKEQAILELQRLLALNRSVVREMVENPPQVLLTNIAKQKAEMVQKELLAHGVKAEYREVQPQ